MAAEHLREEHRMSNIIVGPVCPECGSEGSHNIMRYGSDNDGNKGWAEIVHCMRCEKVWNINLPIAGPEITNFPTNFSERKMKGHFMSDEQHCNWCNDTTEVRQVLGVLLCMYCRVYWLRTGRDLTE